MSKPDFANTGLDRLAQRDLHFLIAHMPRAGGSYHEIAALLNAMPNTLESMLTSDYLFDIIRDRQRLLLDISPFLLFSVLLRRSLGKPRNPLERRVINYLANLLTLFVQAERLYRVEPSDREPQEYVVQLMAGLEQAGSRRQFLTYAHIGNYALWLTGLRASWLEARHRYGRRPVSPGFYEEFGRTSYDRAAKHRLARELALEDVFLRLALMFSHYREGLNRMVRE